MQHKQLLKQNQYKVLTKTIRPKNYKACEHNEKVVVLLLG